MRPRTRFGVDGPGLAWRGEIIVAARGDLSRGLLAASAFKVGGVADETDPPARGMPWKYPTVLRAIAKGDWGWTAQISAIAAIKSRAAVLVPGGF